MKKYNRTYHLPWSPGATNDDRIAEDVSRLVGSPIVITEKLDGENTGMESRGVYARSHAAYTQSAWSTKVRMLHSSMGGSISEGQMIFGENMQGIHSIEYDKLTSWFYMFGSRQETSDGFEWASWEDVEIFANALGVPTVPVLFKGSVSSLGELEELTLSLVSSGSMLGPSIEGVVVRVASAFHDEDFHLSVLKWVRKNHVATDEHWTRNWRQAQIHRV